MYRSEFFVRSFHSLGSVTPTNKQTHKHAGFLLSFHRDIQLYPIVMEFNNKRPKKNEQRRNRLSLSLHQITTILIHHERST